MAGLELTASSLFPKIKKSTNELAKKNLLHGMIDQFFNETELRELYFSLGVDYEDYSGGKANHIMELIMYCSRMGQLADLSDYCSKAKAGHEWPVF